jgi:hypothetical protein
MWFRTLFPCAARCINLRLLFSHEGRLVPRISHLQSRIDCCIAVYVGKRFIVMWQSVSPLFPPEFTRRSGSGGMVRPAIICHLSCDMLIPSSDITCSVDMSKRSFEGRQNSPLLKRNRKTLSCNNCRRQKLKCDRETPACSRCGSTGNADSCTYGRLEIDLLQYPNSRNDEVSLDSLV